MTALFDANGVSSIELFTDTLQRVTTDWGCKVSRQNYPGSFYDRSQGKANKRKSVIGNVTSCYKLVKSGEKRNHSHAHKRRICKSSSRFKDYSEF